LLSQGYLVDQDSPTRLRGHKFLRNESGGQISLEITLVCLPEGEDEGSVVYANAVQTRYELKATTNTTGLTVAGIGSISVPWSESKEALVKAGEETVTDAGFYERFSS
jgi:hypothetical protein